MLQRFLNDNRLIRPTIAVVGDVMVDHYYQVDASRVSPEFPIPILRSDRGNYEAAVPAGAGNTACQFRHFNCDVKLAGFIDTHGQWVMKEAGIDTEACLDMKTSLGHIPIKKRYYSENFPLCRIDEEERDYGLGCAIDEHRRELAEKVMDIEASVVVYADYDKGVFGNSYPMVQDAIKIVDPKNHLDRWKGCDIFKPNYKEACQLTGQTDWIKQCNTIQERLGCMAVVITNAGKGVFGKVFNTYFDYSAKREVVVESVIGAGDCFVAILALCMAHSIDVKDAVEIAFEAAQIYVQRKHNQPVTPEELDLDPTASKLVPIESLQDRDYRLCFTNGCFDILHSGHLHTLRFAKSKADKLVVAVNSDESIRRLKGETRPIIPLPERMKMLASLECVDYVVSFEEDRPFETIKTISPDVLVKGADWESDICGSDIVEEVYAVPLVEGLSTSNIIEKIQTNGDDG